MDKRLGKLVIDSTYDSLCVLLEEIFPHSLPSQKHIEQMQYMQEKLIKIREGENVSLAHNAANLLKIMNVLHTFTIDSLKKEEKKLEKKLKKLLENQEEQLGRLQRLYENGHEEEYITQLKKFQQLNKRIDSTTSRLEGIRDNLGEL